MAAEDKLSYNKTQQAAFQTFTCQEQNEMASPNSPKIHPVPRKCDSQKPIYLKY